MRHLSVATLLIPLWGAVGCDDDTPAAAGITADRYEASSLRVRLGLRNADDDPVVAPGTLELRMRSRDGEELCRWEPTAISEPDFEIESASVTLPGACDAPPRPGAHVDYVLTGTFTTPEGTTLGVENDALYHIAEPGDETPAEASADATRLTVSPYPVTLEAAAGARLQPDPEVAGVVVVAGGPCEVRITEGRDGGGPASGAQIRATLERHGARFSTSEITDDRWALSFTSDGRHGVHHGVVADGHAYLCRGEYDTAERQACAAALCATLRPTGGAAAPAPSGDYVAHCGYENICTQVREDVRRALDPACQMVGQPVQDGPCPTPGPEGPARLGACESRGLTYVYYAAPGWTADRVRQQCDQLHGTLQ